MIKQNLAIFSIPILYKILIELENELNYNILYFTDKKKLVEQDLSSFFILTNQKSFNYDNVIQLDFPLKITKLIEKINIQFIKSKAKKNSNIHIGNYVLDINSRKLTLNSNAISLTEKEVNLIVFLSNSNKPVNIEKLQLKVWGYKNKLETHTVETHIHRLRKKIYLTLKSNDLIVRKKDGYHLNKLPENI